MNEVSLRKFAPTVVAGGLILYNASRPPADLPLPQARVVCIPASAMTDKLGSAKATNIVMMGALLKETECLLPDIAVGVLKEKVKRVEMLETNRKALAAGREFANDKVWLLAASRPNGCRGKQDTTTRSRGLD